MGTKHALIVPVGLQAHFFSIYRHAVELAKRGVIITFVGLQREIDLLKTNSELDGLDFRLLSYHDFGSEHHFQSRDDPQLKILKFLPVSGTLFQPILDKLLADRTAGLPGPSCIIADRMLTWPVDAAKQLGIPYYQYYSCGAIYARELQARAALLDDGTLTLEERPIPFGPIKFLAKFEGYLRIPGLPALQYRDVGNTPPSDEKGVALPNDYKIGLGVGEADGLIVNTCYALEAPQIDAIRESWREKEGSRGKIPNLFLVGPIPNATVLKNRSIVGHLDERGADSVCLQWLDTRPPRSVVFVCFGSVAASRFTPSQTRGLALALEASEKSFLWVVPQSSVGALPPNFEERTRGKGLTFSGWVPQLDILQHPSTGGFVMHCGWNSIIESIISGVPMACWPQIPNDQILNCRYLVDVLKIAVEVRSEDSDANTLTSTLEAAVRLLVSEEGDALRARVLALKEKVEAAVADGGPSRKAFSDEVDSIPP